MWDINVACKKIVEMVIEERIKQPHCIICNGVLFDHDKYLFWLLDDLQYITYRPILLYSVFP